MVYICNHCGFLFHRYGSVQMCPACECLDIRPATEEETKRFYQWMESEPPPEKKSGMKRIPSCGR